MPAIKAKIAIFDPWYGVVVVYNVYTVHVGTCTTLNPQPHPRHIRAQRSHTMAYACTIIMCMSFRAILFVFRGANAFCSLLPQFELKAVLQTPNEANRVLRAWLRCVPVTQASHMACTKRRTNMIMIYALHIVHDMYVYRHAGGHSGVRIHRRM